VDVIGEVCNIIGITWQPGRRQINWRGAECCGVVVTAEHEIYIEGGKKVRR